MATVLEPIEDETKLTIAADIEPGYGILGKALHPLTRGTEEKMFGKALEKLKSILEK